MRRYRLVLLVGVLALVFAGIALNRLRQDSARLTGWLIQLVQDQTGLTVTTSGPGRFRFWPELRLALDGVEIRDGETDLARISSLEVGLPWSTLRGGDIRLGGINIDRIDLHAAPIDVWWNRWFAADAGPPAPWRWPVLEQPVRINRLVWFGTETQAQATFALSDLSVDQWRPDQVGRLSTRIEWPGAEPLPILLVATPRQAGYDLQLSPFALAVDPELSNIAVSGELSLNPLNQGRFSGTLNAADLSKRLSGDLLDFERPSSLTIDWQGQWNGRFWFRANGTLFAEPIHADIALPANWRDHVSPPMALLDVLEGKIEIERLRLGISEWNRLSIEGKPLADLPGPKTVP